MTIEEIKSALAKKGWTQAELAAKLGCNAKGLNEVLRGARPLTEALHNHISLLLAQPREAVLVYRVNITDAQVAELCGANCTTNPADRPAAVEAVIHHNLAELIEIGKKCEWTAEEREFLGIDTAAPTSAPYSRADAQDPFA